MTDTFAALTIAGSDPSGGAGIQADLKTFHQFGVYGMAAITLLTVQNTRTVARVEVADPDLVEQQITAVLADLTPGAVKTGALGNAAIIEAVAAIDFPCPLVVDPVMISKHGRALMTPDARFTLVKRLLPRTALVTPNLHEAAALAGAELSQRDAALAIADLGAASVLVKGGHRMSDANDVLYHRGEFHEFRADRLETPHTHGTGCSYSAAITALMARGVDLSEAVAQAKRWITAAIRTNPGLGGGSGPVNHFAPIG
jgi:hydroxymethylpyrimidine/phosphomethylpyrimidine kinase